MSTTQEKTAIVPYKGGALVAGAPKSAGIVLTSYEQVIKFAKLMTAGGLVKDAAAEAKAAMLIFAGLEMGLGPIEAINGLYVGPGGKIGYQVSMIKQRIIAGGVYSWQILDLQDESVTIEFRKYGKKIELPGNPITWNKKRAIEAKFLTGRNKDTWEAHLQRMLFKQTIMDGYIFFMPDALGNLPAPEADESYIEAVAEERLQDDMIDKALFGEEDPVDSVLDESTGEVVSHAYETKDPSYEERLMKEAEVAREMGQDDIAEKKENLAKITDEQKQTLVKTALRYGWPNPGEVRRYIQATYKTSEKEPYSITVDQWSKAMDYVKDHKPN